MPHESKRIFTDNYYTPRLPEDPNMPSVTSNRLPGDYNVISPHHPQQPQNPQQPQQPQQSGSSFPPIPDDIQARLLHVGMRVRKNVVEGHRNTGGSIPSYQPNFGVHTTATFYGDSPHQQEQAAVLATRIISAPAVFNTTPVPAVCTNRLHLKRGRDDDDDDDDTDDDDDAMDTGFPLASTNATSTASFAGSSSARRLGSESAAKVFYVPASQQQQESFTEDFEDATFLAARDSLS